MGDESVDSLSAPEKTEQGGNLGEESVDSLSTPAKAEEGGGLCEESVGSLSAPELTEHGRNLGEESVDSLSTPEKTEQGGDLGEESVDSLLAPELTEHGRNLGEESVDSLSTPEKTEQGVNTVSLSNDCDDHSGHHLTSVVSHLAGASSTRNSEKSDSSNSGRTRKVVVPHYLRASAGSCHDFCKYGRIHSFEEKPRKPIRRRVAQSLPNELYPDIQAKVSGDKGKKKVVSDHKPTPDAESYSPKPKTSLDKEKVVKSNTSPDLKNNLSDPTSPKTKIDWRKPRNPKMPSDVKTYSPRLSTSSGSRALLLKHKPSSTKKLPLSEPPEIVKSVFFPSKKVEDPAKEVSSTDNKMPRAEKNTTHSSNQRPSLVKSKSLNPNRQSFSQSSDGKNGKGARNSNVATDRNTISSKAPAKKVSETPAATLSPKLKTAHVVNSGKTGNPKLVAPLTNRNRTRLAKTKTSNNEKVPEKTLHVVKTETDKDVSEDVIHDDHAMSSSSHAKSSSLSSCHEEEETEHSGAESDEAIKNLGKVPPPKRENNNHSKTLRKNKAVVVSEDKSCSPVKLMFRSGKVVDIQSENNGPRRLRFRRARILALEDKGDSRRRTLKKAEVNDDKTNSEVSSEKVVLKHQDVQGKKDAQGLFNNVIEETASKLVESRKSKVKALVGAFETVISLQESKPSTQAVS